MRSGYLLFAVVHYMAVELDGGGRVEYEDFHLPSLVTIYFLYGVRLPPEYPSVTYCVKKSFGVQQFPPLSTNMPSLSLVALPPSETTTTLNPPSPIPMK